MECNFANRFPRLRLNCLDPLLEPLMTRLSFTEHPETVGETYGEHFHTASGFGLRLVLAGIACLIHGLFPFLFVATGSKTIALLYDRMIVNRRRAAASSSRGEPVSA